MTIEAFCGGPDGKGDEEYFYVVADALEEIGDVENAARFRAAKWGITDKWEAIEEVHGPLIEKIRNCPPSEFVETVQEIAKHKYLYDFVLEFVEISKEHFKIFASPLETNRFLGNAARTLFLLNKNEIPRPGWYAFVKYRLCIFYGLYKDAAKWRKLGTKIRHWKVA